METLVEDTGMPDKSEKIYMCKRSAWQYSKECNWKGEEIKTQSYSEIWWIYLRIINLDNLDHLYSEKRAHY
jgi:hypothetical protein